MGVTLEALKKRERARTRASFQFTSIGFLKPVEVQSKSPQNIPLKYADPFQLKTT